MSKGKVSKQVKKTPKKTKGNKVNFLSKKAKVGVFVIAFIGLSVYVDGTFSAWKMGNQVELDEKRYETISQYLGVGKENLIVSLSNKHNVYDVKTEEGNYKVVFSNDFSKVKHLVLED